MQTLNVDFVYQVRVIGKFLNLPEQEDIILNSTSKRKWDFRVVSREDFRMKWRCHAIFAFSVEWERLPALLWFFFFESVLLKVLDQSYVQSSFLTIARKLDKSIWKTPYNWRFYGHGSLYVSSLHKDIWHIAVYFSFSQTSLVFKFNLIMNE